MSTLAQAAFAIGRRFTIGGPAWTRTRLTAHTPGADGTSATESVTAYVVPQLPRQGQSETAWPIFDSQWVVIAREDTAIAAQDSITDGVYTFTITGAPVNMGGFLLAPAEQH